MPTAPHADLERPAEPDERPLPLRQHRLAGGERQRLQHQQRRPLAPLPRRVALPHLDAVLRVGAQVPQREQRAGACGGRGPTVTV